LFGGAAECTARFAAVKELAKMRGEAYFEDAKKYLSRRDYRNARATALERENACAPVRFL
jgi:hypothetical protein